MQTNAADKIYVKNNLNRFGKGINLMTHFFTANIFKQKHRKTLMLVPLLLSACCLSITLHAEKPKACPEATFKQADQAWAGHYYLEGVMEVGSELLLEKNGKFKWYLAVGALDQYAEGTWWKNENCIGLKAAPKFLRNLQIFPAQLSISDKNLDVSWMDGRQQGRYVLAQRESSTETE